MRRSFQPTVITNAFEILMSMKQEGNVREYRKSFEIVSSYVKVQDQELFLGLFSNRLREDIRAKVRLQRPKDLAEMMDVALLAEEKIGAVGRYGGQRATNHLLLMVPGGPRIGEMRLNRSLTQRMLPLPKGKNWEREDNLLGQNQLGKRD